MSGDRLGQVMMDLVKVASFNLGESGQLQAELGCGDQIMVQLGSVT